MPTPPRPDPRSSPRPQPRSGPRSLTRAQAEEVGRRLNPREGQDIRFSRHGVVLHTAVEQAGAMAADGEVFCATRRDGVMSVDVRRADTR